MNTMMEMRAVTFYSCIVNVTNCSYVCLSVSLPTPYIRLSCSNCLSAEERRVSSNGTSFDVIPMCGQWLFTWYCCHCCNVDTMLLLFAAFAPVSSVLVLSFGPFALQKDLHGSFNLLTECTDISLTRTNSMLSCRE